MPRGIYKHKPTQGYQKGHEPYFGAKKLPSDILVPHDGIVEIVLTQGKLAIIDAEDYPKIMKHRWHAQKHRNTFYATTNIQMNGGSLRMHQILIPYDTSYMVDHANGNGLDNRKSNLRQATAAQNGWNRGKQINNTSGFKGVCLHKASKKWAAEITLNGKQTHLGLFETPQEASNAYTQASKELHGAFGRIS